MGEDNKEVKETLDIIKERSLRDLVDHVNAINCRGITKILKEDIVTVIKGENSFYLLYYK